MIWWNQDIWDMRNWDIQYIAELYDMLELGYLGYGGTRISMIWWNQYIQDMVELGYLVYDGL